MRISDWSSDVCSSHLIIKIDIIDPQALQARVEGLRQALAMNACFIGIVASRHGVGVFGGDDKTIAVRCDEAADDFLALPARIPLRRTDEVPADRKSTRLNSSH